jgi:transposase
MTTATRPPLAAGAAYAGIDVSKAHLDLALQPQGRPQRLPNDEAGIASLVAQL